MANKVRLTVGERKIYQSSPGVGREFCDQCGTPLTIEIEKHDPPTIKFHVSTFDVPDAYISTLHWYQVGGLPGSTSPTICPAITDYTATA